MGQHPISAQPRLFLRTLAVLLLAASASAPACQICFSGRVVTVGQQLDAADQAVLALPEADETQFRVIEAIKGDAAAYSMLTEPVSRADTPAIRSGRPLLLLHNAPGRRWVSAGPISLEYAGWLRKLSATAQQEELGEADWNERVVLSAPYIEAPDPLAADIAYGEIASVPYRALRSLKLQLDAQALRHWIDTPRLASRRPAYTLLLGIAGEPQDMQRLEQRLDAALKAHDATNVSAMLAADLELRGPSRIAWIEKRYFADRSRTMPEIEAALLALKVHGDTDGAVPRSRVIEAYRVFMRQRKPMAGFVAPQLAEWSYWDATPEYVALLKSKSAPDPASRYAILTYLQRSPRADAKAALEALDTESR
jgi:hypothetical protein